MKRDCRLLPHAIEITITNDVLDEKMSLDEAILHRERLLQEYDANENLIINPGDKFGIEYRGYKIAQRFDTAREAEAWALYNYKGSLKGWRVITRPSVAENEAEIASGACLSD